MYAFTSIRPGAIFTHIINYTKEQYDEMSDHSHCFSQSDRNNWISFIHLTEADYDSFIKLFNITMVDSKQELKFLQKLTE